MKRLFVPGVLIILALVAAACAPSASAPATAPTTAAAAAPTTAATTAPTSAVAAAPTTAATSEATTAAMAQATSAATSAATSEATSAATSASTSAPATSATAAATSAAAVPTIAIGGVTSPTPYPKASFGRFDGVTVNIVTFTGPQIAEPLQRHAPEFAQLTGAKINVITVPMSDLYQKILTDFSTHTNSYDALVYDPQWMGDFASAGFLLDLTSMVQSDSYLGWNDILPYFRDFSATYQGKVYDVPFDGDVQMVYYRTDLLQQAGMQPPKTWDDYLAIAKKFQGATFPDGKPGYGSCIAMKRGAQSYWMFLSILTSFEQTQGTKSGAFFDPTNMNPLVNNAGGLQALSIYQQLSKLGPPDQLNEDVGDSRGLFTSGRCALTLDWGDIGSLATDPSTSKVQHLVGSVITPGTSQVVDRSSGQLVPCSATTCPNAIDGVNHAPFAAFGGWSGAINKSANANVQKAAFAFFSFVGAPPQSDTDVTLGKTGFNPYRQSQFENLGPWLASGMNDADAKSYLGAISQELTSPNMVLDMRIPQNSYYEGVVLDNALATFLAGQTDAATTAKQISDGWDAKTNEIGRQNVLSVYDATLNVTR